MTSAARGAMVGILAMQCVLHGVAALAAPMTVAGQLYPPTLPGEGNKAVIKLEVEIPPGCDHARSLSVDAACPSNTQTSFVQEKRTPYVSRFDASLDYDPANTGYPRTVTFSRLTLVGSDLQFELGIIRPKVEELRIELDYPSYPYPSGIVDPTTGAFLIRAHVRLIGKLRPLPTEPPQDIDKATALWFSGNITVNSTLGKVGWFTLTSGSAVLDPMWDTLFGYTFWISGTVTLNQASVHNTLRQKADYNGDGQGDLGVFRQGMWFLQYSADYQGVDASVPFGSPVAGSDEPQIGEFSCLGEGGGGKPDQYTDIVFLRKPSSTWTVTVGPTWGGTPALIRPFGTTSHKFLPSRRVDTNVDGCSDIAAFKDGCFHVMESPYYSGIDTTVCLGTTNDIPLVGDLNGDGMTDFGVRNPGQGTFFFTYSPDWDTIDKIIPFGVSSDIPLVGDVNGDGLADVGVYRPVGSTFFFACAPDFSGICLQKTHGVNGDIPVIADVDGDGKDDLGIFRPTSAGWSFRCSASPNWGVCLSRVFGLAGDLPIYGTPAAPTRR